MKFTFFQLGKPVLNLDGTEAKRLKKDAKTNDDVESFTVKEAFRQALNGAFFDEQASQANPAGLSMEDRMKRFELSKKIWNCNQDETVDLVTEEVAELKKCCGKMFVSPEVFGFLEAVIEGKDQAAE